jgi:hypothetical protein
VRSYADFLASKRVTDPSTGLATFGDLNAALFPFQRDVVSWALKRGRSALFAGTGLGKTLMELSWGDAVYQATGGMILYFAPPAVAAAQIIPEARKFGVEARLVRSQAECLPGINVTNYQKIDHFNLSAFVGIILDESSVLKSKDGHYRTKLINEAASVPFRLAATATPAPNDFTEMGNHAEFLGVMRHTDMLATFFTHDSSETQTWRLKGHAEQSFWQWMSSWAVMLRKPSDLGYDNGGFDLPPLRQHQHAVEAEYAPSIETGLLFPMQAATLQERLAVRRSTVDVRVSRAASITPKDQPFVWWCNLNSESEALARAIPDAVELRGSDDDGAKERKLTDFTEGRIRVLVTKASICGWGMNWQHCNQTGFVGLNDSFEQVYQAIRRFWRFGQTMPVDAHFIAAETEGAVVANLRRKEHDADRMAAAMVQQMAGFSKREVRGMERDRPTYDPCQPMRLPAWIGEAA